MSKRYDQCDETCTTDCGHCKGAGPPKTEVEQAKARVAEFVRQWEIQQHRGRVIDTVYRVHFDPEADEGAELTISDLKTLMEGAR